MEAWIIAPVKESYPIEKGVSVANLGGFLSKDEDAERFRGEVAHRAGSGLKNLTKGFKCS
jgi:hypothetical protein